MSEGGWASRAACRSYPTLPWIAEDADLLLVAVMVEVCLACPVVVDCRAEAAGLEARGIDLVGVWGGEVKADRSELVGV